MNRAIHHAVGSRRGSALLLVVVVTMLLSTIGILFIITARVRSIAASGTTDNRELNAAVQSVVGRVDTVLVQDLFGASLNRGIIDGTDPNNEPYDGSNVDSWLASLEPDATTFKWPYITNLSGGTVMPTWNKVSAIVADYQDENTIASGAIADADGDGVADSMWIKLPNLTTSKGKPVYAAVRIIDNCAMLNLNTAFGFYQPAALPWQSTPWSIGTMGANFLYPRSQNYGTDIGRYLSEVNFGPFLRGHDVSRIERIQLARDAVARANSTLLPTNPDFCNYGVDPASPNDYPRDYHNLCVMSIENPGKNFSPFDIGDELEIRNRFLLTSQVIARFEKSDEDETNDADLYPPYFSGFNTSGKSYVGIGYQTFDWGRGELVSGWNVDLKVKRIPCKDSDDLIGWKKRLNPANFDSGTYANYYDRRHVCTFYSFDRNIRTAQTSFYTFLDSQPEAVRYVFVPKNKAATTTNIQNLNAAQPYNNTETRRKILHLLYAFREYFEKGGLTRSKAAIQSAQIVANMIDYSDGDNATTEGPFFNTEYKSQRDPNMTFIDRSIVNAMIAGVSNNNPAVVSGGVVAADFDFGLTATDVVYGYERQPFISEVYCQYNASGGGATAFAVELINPYADALNLEGWRIQIGTQTYPLAGGYANIPSGRLVIYSTGMAAGTSGTWKSISGFGLGMPMTGSGNVLRLQRSDPANSGQFLTVDRITDNATDGIANGQREHLITNGARVTKRQDTNWGFANLRSYVNDAIKTLGTANNITVAGGYALPVANDGQPIERLADFERVAFVSNQPDPNAITAQIAAAAGEAGVRFDINTASSLLGYICTLNRDEGNLPGRININTAPKYVIAAAIPPQLIISSGDPNTALTLAGDIVANRPYRDLADLLKIPAIKKYANNNPAIVGDTSINNDFEKRDWILSRLSNIFTVRSDTFTASILVRLGTDGPQRRMIAIFDRSNVWLPTDKPKLVTLHPVPDPR
jgi:hypothetical protein